MEHSQFYLINLSPDPSMNESLVYYLRSEETKVGSSEEQHIRLLGVGIKPEHCLIEREAGQLHIVPRAGANTCINGLERRERTVLRHGDRILWGSNNFFRAHCPATEDERTAGLEAFDWARAQEEVLMSSNTAVFSKMMSQLEQKYQQEKLEARAAQTREGETADQDQQKHSEFKASLERLKAGLLKASEMVRQANFLASELQRPVKYSGEKNNDQV